MKKIVVSQNEQGVRLDLYLFQKNPEYSRSYFGQMIKSGHVLVNDSVVKPSYIIKTGEIVGYDLIEKPALGPVMAEDIPLEIIFENDDAVVINKQAGLVVHPAAGNHTGTLVNALAYRFPAIKKAVYKKGSEISESRPGLVHRLDKDTSGVLIIAKNTKAMIFLAGQIKKRSAKKSYLAICAGWPKNESDRLVNYLGRDTKNRRSYTEVGKEKGREAISNFFVADFYTLKTGERISLVKFDIETGRTHQIRVQAKIAGFPVIGDKVYCTKESEAVSRRANAQRQMLHAKELTILLPKEKKTRTFVAPVPEDFLKILRKLHSQS